MSQRRGSLWGLNSYGRNLTLLKYIVSDIAEDRSDLSSGSSSPRRVSAVDREDVGTMIPSNVSNCVLVDKA